MDNTKTKTKDLQSLAVYLKVIELDYPQTNCAEKAKLIQDTFGIEYTEEEIFNYYHVDEEPDYEWLNDIARNR